MTAILSRPQCVKKHGYWAWSINMNIWYGCQSATQYYAPEAI